jgi:hypothetical protein
MKKTLLYSLLLGGLVAGTFVGCAGYVDDDGDYGPAYAGPGFYGGVWYDSGPYYGGVPYGHGYYDNDHHWHGGGTAPAPHPGGGSAPHPGGGRPPHGVPSVPNAPRPGGGGHSGGGGGGGHGGGGGGGGGHDHK